MAKIPTYERNPQAQQLGGTTKISTGGSPVAQALGQLGGTIQNIGGQIAQVRDDGALASAEVSRLERTSALEKNFNGLISAGQATIEDKPQYMADSMKLWQDEVSSGWKGSKQALESVMQGHELALAKEQVKYNADVMSFQLERAVVEQEKGYSTALFTNDVEKQGIYSAKLEQILGPVKFQAFASNAQTEYAGSTLVNLDSLTALKTAQEDMKTGAAWNGLDYVDATDRAKLQKANSQRQAQLTRLIEDAQWENSLKIDAEIESGRLLPQQLDSYEAQGQQADSPSEEVGISKKYAIVARGKLEDSLRDSMPDKQWNNYQKWEKKISTDNREWGKNPYESAKELEKYHDKILNDSDLNNSEKYYLYMASSRVFAKRGKPSVSRDLATKISNLSEIEAKLISRGVDINLGASSYDFIKAVGDNDDEEAIAAHYEKKLNTLKPMLEAVVLKELSGKKTYEQPFNPETAPVGTERADANGIVWVKMADGNWETK